MSSKLLKAAQHGDIRSIEKLLDGSLLRKRVDVDAIINGVTALIMWSHFKTYNLLENEHRKTRNKHKQLERYARIAARESGLDPNRPLQELLDDLSLMI